jgi:hypothetical protein
VAEQNPIESMNLAQLREAAADWRIIGAGRLTRKELVVLLRHAKRLEGKSLTELRNMARQSRISGVSKVQKKVLVEMLLGVEQLEAMTAEKLRALARQEGIEGAQRLKKADLVQQLLKLKEMHPVEEAPAPEIGLAKPRERILGIPWKRWMGNAIRVAAGMGVICCLSGMILICFLPTRTIIFANEVLDALLEGIRSTSTSLEMVRGTIQEAIEVLEDAGVTLIAVGDSIEDMGPMIESLGVLVGEEAPAAIESTREALISVEEGARAIDGVLRGLARISLLTGITYDPDQPLDEGIAEVAAGLETMPAALEAVHEDMGEATDNLDEVGLSLVDVADQLDRFVGELGDLEDRIVELNSTLEARMGDIDAAAECVPTLVWGTFAVMELFFLWIVLGQCAVFFVGDQVRGMDVG